MPQTRKEYGFGYQDAKEYKFRHHPHLFLVPISTGVRLGPVVEGERLPFGVRALPPVEEAVACALRPQLVDHAVPVEPNRSFVSVTNSERLCRLKIKETRLRYISDGK